jgi:hypothetical protein
MWFLGFLNLQGHLLTQSTKPAIAEPLPLPFSAVEDFFSAKALNTSPKMDKPHAKYWTSGNHPKIIPKIPKKIARIPIVIPSYFLVIVAKRYSAIIHHKDGHNHS